MRRQASTVGSDKKRRRVLVVVTFAVGGIRTYMRYVYSRLNREKYAFTILAYDSSEREALEEDAKHYQTDKLIFIKPRYGYRLLFWSVLREVLKERYDLIHSQGIFAAFNVGLVNFLFGIPHIFTVHGLLEESDLKGFSLLRSLKLNLLSFVLKSADVMHHVSQDMVEQYRKLLPGVENSKCKIVMISHGIDVESYAEEKRCKAGSLRNDLGIGCKVFLIGYLGRFMDRKGFPILIDAVQIIETENLIEKEYLIIAVGSGDRQKRYFREVNKRGLSNKIKFIPFRQHVQPIISEMDLIIMPSLWEACGLLAMEVLCIGTPLIASDCLGLREVTKDTPTISVPTGNAQALAEAIAMAVKSPADEEFERFRGEAYRRFDVRHSAVGLEKIYDLLCKTKLGA